MREEIKYAKEINAINTFVLKFQSVMTFILMTIAAILPDNSFTEWLFDILPPLFFVSDTFPLTSKIVNNYIFFSSIVIGLFISYKEYDLIIAIFRKSKVKGLYFIKVPFLALILVSIFTFLYLNTIENPNDSTISIIKNYVLFGIASPAFSMTYAIFIYIFVVSFKKFITEDLFL